MSDVQETASPAITLDDLRRLVASGAPGLADAVLAFLDQPDPDPPENLPDGVLTLDAVVRSIKENSDHRRPDDSRKRWQEYAAQPSPPQPPRLGLCDLLVDAYASGSEASRAALIDLTVRAPLVYGLFGAFKRIYKLSESRHDAEMFGALAARFDIAYNDVSPREVTRWTRLYLRRRAWRYLRVLGPAMPSLYARFAVEVLKHYTNDTNFKSLWVANHIWLHRSKRYDLREFGMGSLPSDLYKQRAFDDAWKLSPEPLLHLLETCNADVVARFAVTALQKDFAEALRQPSTAWLSRLALRPLAEVHEFLVETLEASADLHQSKLRQAGLHDTVLSLLTSQSGRARTYAIAYARAHAQDLDAHRLIALLDGPKDVVAFASSALQSRDAKVLGPHVLSQLLAIKDTAAWARKQLDAAFDRSEFSASFLRDMIFGAPAQRTWVKAWLEASYKPQELGAAFWMAALDDPRAAQDDAAHAACLSQLAKYPADEVGGPWLLRALTTERLHAYAAQQLRKALKVSGLDVEALKGLVFAARWREAALAALDNTKLLSPQSIGVSWLLALARRADPTLHDFAKRYVLENLRPGDFDESGDAALGAERLFALALGSSAPEPLRVVAQTYLLCHHPVLNKTHPEARALKLKAQLPRTVFTADRGWNALWDMRSDVRAFAVALTRVELRPWGRIDRVYELAENEDRAVRLIAYEALQNAGDPDAAVERTLKLTELDADKVFGLTESPRKPSREVGMEVIRKHYARIGGAERLGWLMESPDREVRLFAVRLLWEKHRPRETPAGWTPSVRRSAEAVGQEPFADGKALRDFLRRVLYGIAPGRMERRESAAGRKISASVAKRNVIEVVRDMGVDDVAFARLAAPVLGEFTGSLGRGEWQACLSAIAFLRSAHPGETLGGVEG